MTEKEPKEQKLREHEGDTRREDLGCWIVLVIYLVWSIIVGAALDAIFNK
jgi:hypothetical protein